MRCFQLLTLGDSKDKSLAFISTAPEGIGIFDYCLSEGEPIGDQYPEDARIYLQRQHPGIRLTTLFGNTLCFLIVHASMKDVLLEHVKTSIEALPFTLYNHKKRVHSREYWIINPLAIVNCVDKEHSDITYFDKDPTKVVGVRKLVFDARKLEGQPALFRVPEARTKYFVKDDLAVALTERPFTNLVATEIEVLNGGSE